MNTLFKKSGIYRETEGVHAAGLFTPEAKPVCIVEDIGRHNTLDKVIGYALLNRVNGGEAAGAAEPVDPVDGEDAP